MVGCGGNDGGVSAPTTTTTSGISTGNLTFTGSFSPVQPKVGEPVTFSFVKDDPDASVDYVCGQWSYGTSEFFDHIPCQPRGGICPNTGTVYTPVHGHREWTDSYTYTKPGTYIAQFTTRSGDLYGCNPYSDDASLTLEVVVTP